MGGSVASLVGSVDARTSRDEGGRRSHAPRHGRPMQGGLASDIGGSRVGAGSQQGGDDGGRVGECGPLQGGKSAGIAGACQAGVGR